LEDCCAGGAHVVRWRWCDVRNAEANSRLEARLLKQAGLLRAPGCPGGRLAWQAGDGWKPEAPAVLTLFAGCDDQIRQSRSVEIRKTKEPRLSPKPGFFMRREAAAGDWRGGRAGDGWKTESPAVLTLFAGGVVQVDKSNLFHKKKPGGSN